MLYLKYIVLGGLFLSCAAVAQEAPEGGRLKANLRRLGLEMSSTEVKNAEAYQNSPVSQFNADSQTMIKGIFDGALEYENKDLQWVNSLLLEYGKTKLKPVDGENETNENADQILLTSEYTHKMWQYKTVDFGPMASLGFQSEFTKNQDAPRTKILRGKAGFKVFNGKIIKDLYVAGVYEYDMTYPEHVSKSAAEIGWRLAYDFKENLQFSSDGYYRDYLTYSHYIAEDLKYDFKATARMDANLTNTLTFGPYVSYRQGKARGTDKTGSNFVIGLSLVYKDIFEIF